MAVIARAGRAGLGYPLLDPAAALVIVAFIGHAGFEIARDAARILSDEIVISEEDVRRVVQSVPDACWGAIRSARADLPITCFWICTSGWMARRR